MLIIHEAHPVRDEGTVVVFEGFDADDGEVVWFGVDHRFAPLVALVAEEGQGVGIGEWQVLARTAPGADS